jgi:hypothetical protein
VIDVSASSKRACPELSLKWNKVKKEKERKKERK